MTNFNHSQRKHVFSVTLSSALRCYTCNSDDNSECFSPPMNFTEEEYRDKESVPGRLLRECPLDEQGREPFCRSQYLLVLGGNLPDHTRVWRECGYERAKRPCYRFENGGHDETVCQCFTDGCNGATQGTISLLVLIASAGLLTTRMLARSA
ncbi:uncharacterized protein LOC128722827 [Anopheles nili]|uniref:uncharacterized protein LOC128722827 n=1 Tax=Anopheles nili TaxID=185578 RepID=UPI00237B998F|nr:uncharacterized protein LOC128722827 [Anopheles nili]